MVFSDVDIKRLVASGDIVISPYDESRLKQASYTFTLDNLLLHPRKAKEIDARKPTVDYKEIVMDDAGYLLKPGDFVLARLKEALTLSTKVCCTLDARTTLTRVGLNVLQASTLTEPGQQDSHETLEITNVGNSPVRIYPDLPVAKGIFHFLKTPASHGYTGKYLRQKNPHIKS